MCCTIPHCSTHRHRRVDPLDVALVHQDLPRPQAQGLHLPLPEVLAPSQPLDLLVEGGVAYRRRCWWCCCCGLGENRGRNRGCPHRRRRCGGWRCYCCRCHVAWPAVGCLWPTAAHGTHGARGVDMTNKSEPAAPAANGPSKPLNCLICRAAFDLSFVT